MSYRVVGLGVIVGLAMLVTVGCGQFERGPYLLSMKDGELQVLFRPAAPLPAINPGGWLAGLPADTFVQVMDADGKVLAAAAPVANADGTHVASLAIDQPARAASYRLAAAGRAISPVYPVALPRDQGPTRLVLYGDTRTNPNDHRAVAEAIAREPGVHGIVHVGDFVTDGSDPRQWDPEFFAPARTMLTRCPIYPVLGNHERRAAPYFEAFNMPKTGGYYSRRIGLAHIIVLDLYQDWSKGSTQYQWLEQELAGVPAGTYKIVVFHEPLFSAESRRSHSIKLIRGLGDLLSGSGVDLMVCGHDHHYVRSSVIGATVGQAGTTFLVTGGGGAPSREPKPVDWARKTRAGLQYVVLDINDRGWLTLSARDTRGREFDRYSLAAPGRQVAELAMGSLAAEQLVQTDLETAFQDHFLINKEVAPGQPISAEFKVPLKNVASVPVDLTVSVAAGTWQVELPQSSFHLDPGGAAEAVIRVAHDGKAELYPTPTVTCQYKLGGLAAEPLEVAMSLATAPTGSLPRVAGPLALDGMLTEKFWADTPRLGYLLREDGKGLATGRTDMIVAAGPDAMYVAVVCGEDQLEKVRARAKAYDDPKVWSDDCVELFIEPVKDSKVYYQMVVSITGQRFDGKGEDVSWNGKWEAKVTRSQSNWTFEARIPWSTLGMSGPPAPGTRMGFNVGRTRNAVKELSQWSRIPSGKSHTPEKFGTLVVK